MGTSHLQTYSGLLFEFRPASPNDQPRLAEFWQHTSRKDIGARYLGMDDPSRAILPEETHDRTIDACLTFLALGGDAKVVSIGVLALQRRQNAARVMVFTREDITSHGISWALLARVLTEAQASGAATVSSILNVDDIAAIKLEVRMGFAESVYLGDESLRQLQWTFPERALPAKTAP